MKVKVGLVLAIPLLLGACVGMQHRDEQPDLFADDLFGLRPELPQSEDLFALNESMHAYLQTNIVRRARRIGPKLALAEALRTDLSLDYEATSTRTAAQAFDERVGNCLSLVMLAGAFAKPLDIPVTYQSVHGYGTWSRSEDIAFLNEHVNLVLGVQAEPGHTVLVERPLTVDFLGAGDIPRQRTRPISEATLIAMFMNNRAAESLVDGDVRHAYWWARAAVEQDHTFLAAYNTLGVVYMRHRALRHAEDVLRFAHTREPGNPQVLANLVKLMTRLGRLEDSARFAQMLAEVERHPPYYFLDRGLEALAAGDVARAMSLLRKAQARMPHDHEVHFGIALAHLQRGNIGAARRHLEKAADASPTRERRAIYAAKLDRLNATLVN
jgi:Flp pilus assembly protein TadD